MMAALIPLLWTALQGAGADNLIETVKESNLEAARRAIEALVSKGDERSARLLAGSLPRARQRQRFLAQALVPAERAYRRYETMPVLTPADREEREQGMERERKRLRSIAKMMRDTEEIYDALRESFRGMKGAGAVAGVAVELESAPFWLTRCEMAAAMGLLGHGDAEKRLRERLKREPDPLVAATLVDALGGRVSLEPETEAVVAARLQDKAWPVALVAARTLSAGGANGSVGALVEALQKADGRVKNEIDDALKSITKADMGGDAGAWADWWKANGEDFRAGTYNPKEPKRLPGVGRTTFYRLPVVSTRVVFVIDRSESMEAPAGEGEPRKIDVVRDELKRLMAGLPDGTRINFIFFNDRTTAFCSSTKALDARVRKEAAEYLDRLQPSGGTNLLEALDRALDLVGNRETGALREDGVDTIYLLTDGEPTLGLIRDPDVLAKWFTRANRFFRTAVYTVSVNASSDFLTKLAEWNDGKATAK